MPKFRTIDPDFWKHPFFRQQPWFVRDVFLFLVTAFADDEGRFRMDAFSILEGAFSRLHSISADDVSRALTLLVNEALTLRYGDNDEYGFLTGWYEHQYIQKDRRSESSLPAPPLELSSWAEVDKAREEYSKVSGRPLALCFFSDTVHWYNNEKRYRTANEPLPKRRPEVEVEGKGSRREVEGKLTASVSEQPSETAPPVDNSKPPLKKETPKQRTARQLQEREDTWAQFTPAEQTKVQHYLDAWAEGLESKAMTTPSETNRMLELLTVREAVGNQAFLYGIEQALSANVPNPNYVKKAALSRAQQPQRTMPAKTETKYPPGSFRL